MLKFKPNPDLKLIDQVKEVLRYHHYAYRTEETYIQWILRYIYFTGGTTHPKELGEREIEAFLSNLATVEKVSASTQRQALNALVFLYTEVLDLPLREKIAPIRSSKKTVLPTVLTVFFARDSVKNFIGMFLLFMQLRLLLFFAPQRERSKRKGTLVLRPFGKIYFCKTSPVGLRTRGEAAQTINPEAQKKFYKNISRKK